MKFKAEATFNEGIYLIPSFTINSFQFLFWILYSREGKDTDKVIYPTPFIAISWYKGKIEIWLLFLNWGFRNIKFKKFPQHS